MITNPSVCIAPDSGILLYYRGKGTRIGLAMAPDPDTPFTRPLNRPVVDIGDRPVEDPFVFWLDDHYEMLCKDLSGNVVGEFHGGVHLWSTDGTDWRLADSPKAWSRTMPWDDGITRTQANIERPFILFETGRPAYLFAATADGPGPQRGRPGFCFAEHTWNMVIPLTS